VVEVVVGVVEAEDGEILGRRKIPEMETPVAVASWSVVVAARPEKPWTCMFRRGSKIRRGSVAIAMLTRWANVAISGPGVLDRLPRWQQITGVSRPCARSAERLRCDYCRVRRHTTTIMSGCQPRRRFRDKPASGFQVRKSPKRAAKGRLFWGIISRRRRR
jgi:hypothetical protein